MRVRRKKKAVQTEKRIVMRDGKHCVVSQDGSKNLGCYDTHAEAVERLRQVEGHKKAEEELAKIAAGRGDSRVPAVLTPEAVVAKAMPPLGSSGIPESLEGDVPASYRYWLAKDESEAHEVRTALVETGLFVDENLLEVDGSLRRVVRRTYLASESAEKAELVAPIDAAQAGALALVASETPVKVFELEQDSDPELDIVAKKASVAEPWLAAYVDEPEIRAAARKHELTCFALRTRPGVVFVALAEVDKSAPWVVLDEQSPRGDSAQTPDPSDGVIKAAFSRETRLIKAEGAEERFVLGVVLEPDTVDSQKDTYSAEEVRKAAHRFMENYGNLGLQHDAIITGKIKILESYVAPSDFQVGEETVKAGTWMLAIRAVDDGIWESIKSGSLTGFSIGGSAIRTEETSTSEAA